MFNLTHVKNRGYSNKKSSTIPVINFVNNITRDIKPFYVNDSETCLLFFDIFYKNNKVYLIMPIYNEPYTTADFTIIHNNKNLLP